MDSLDAVDRTILLVEAACGRKLDAAEREELITELRGRPHGPDEEPGADPVGTPVRNPRNPKGSRGAQAVPD